MSNLHPIFEDIVNAFTGRPASVSGHIISAAAAEAPDHGGPDRNAVAAENLSAAGVTPEDLDDARRRMAAIKDRARERIRATMDKIDGKHPSTPRTRLPWEDDHA